MHHFCFNGCFEVLKVSSVHIKKVKIRATKIAFGINETKYGTHERGYSRGFCPNPNVHHPIRPPLMRYWS